MTISAISTQALYNIVPDLTALGRSSVEACPSGIWWQASYGNGCPGWPNVPADHIGNLAMFWYRGAGSS
jgi:hypothetical protein